MISMEKRVSHKPKKCEYHLCKEKTDKLYKCDFCGGFFCKKHSSPKIPLVTDDISKEKNLDVKMFLEKEWRKEDAHPCMPYGRDKLKELRENEESYSKSLDRIQKHHIKEPEVFYPKYKPPKIPFTANHKIPVKPIIAVIILIVVLFYLYNNPQIISTISNSLINGSKQTNPNVQTPIIPTIQTPLQPTLEDLVKNPESFLNKEITVSGGILSYDPIIEDFIKKSGISLQVTYSNVQGYHYEVYVKPFQEEHRTISIGSSYKLKGTVKYVEACSCEFRFVDETGMCVGYINVCYDNYGERFKDCSKKPFPIINTKTDIHYNATIEGFTTNATNTDFAKPFELPAPINWITTSESSYSYYHNQLSSTCPIGKTNFNCNYTVYQAEPDNPYYAYSDWHKVGEGTNQEVDFYKEYRCNPDSIQRIYYIEGTEPMVKIS